MSELVYKKEEPVLVMNKTGHELMSKLMDMALRSYGNEVLPIVNAIIANNLLVHDDKMKEVFNILDKKLKDHGKG